MRGKREKKQGFMAKVRNTFLLIVLAVVIFLAGLFGNIFPGLNDYRDELLEKTGYYETVETIKDGTITDTVALPVSKNEVLIKGDAVYYMENEVSIGDLSAILDQEKPEFVTMVDGGATQRTWDEVEGLLEGKNIAIKQSTVQ
jgi:hypothetical protein